MTQAALARDAGLSPSYLNLIEHGRRNVGGVRLAQIARALGTTAQHLSIGADPDLIAALRRAAASEAADQAEPDNAADFAEIFPAWARLAADQGARIARQERALAAMADRMAHDPVLGASVHDVLSAVTAIRSTAGILAGDDPVDPEWRRRFHRNLYEDSRRLAEGARRLAAHLGDERQRTDARALAPVEVSQDWLAGTDLSGLEAPGDAGMAALEALTARAAAELSDPVAAGIARTHLALRQRDAATLPRVRLGAVRAAQPDDPFALAHALSRPAALVMRRLASVRDREAGLVTCDGTGTLTYRGGPPDIPLPRVGAACAAWPLFQALSQPGRPISARISVAGPASTGWHAHAVAEARWPDGPGGPAIVEATMLVLPGATQADVTVGPGCRVCGAAACPARREPSALGAG